MVVAISTCVLGNRTSEDWSVDPEADLCPGATLLNKVLEAVPSTEGQERIHTQPNPW